MSSPTHKIIQKTLLSILPHASLEHRFPSIDRIADVALLPEKIIFEVQCSFISISEVEKRIADYATLGFTVIWILHHQTFNQWRAHPVELFLRKFYPCYFSSITPHGLGFIYDQLEFFDSLKRIYKGPPLMIDSFLPLSLKKMQNNFPQTLKDKKYSLYLKGDLTDHLLKNKGSNWAKKIEKKYTTTRIEKCLHYIRDFFRYLLFINSGRQQKAYEHRHEPMQNKEKLLSKEQNIPLPS